LGLLFVVGVEGGMGTGDVLCGGVGGFFMRCCPIFMELVAPDSYRDDSYRDWR